MKITLNTKTILNAISFANQFMSKDGTFKERVTFSLVPNENKLLVATTDNLQALELKVSFTTLELIDFTAFSINGKDLLKVLKAVDKTEVTLEISEKILLVKNGRSRVKLDIFDEPQEIVKNEEVKTTITATAEFIKALKQSEHAIADNNPKYELTGVSLKIVNGRLEVVSTDTKRLMIQRISCDSTLDDVIIPKDFVKTLIKNFDGADIEIKISETEVFISSDNMFYSCKTINSKYVPYERIIPQSFKHQIEISTTMLKAMIKEVTLFENSIIINIRDNKITMTDTDEKCETFETFNSDSNVLFKIDSKNILDFLSATNEEEVEICFNEANLPIVFKTNEDTFSIIMPLAMLQEDINKAA